MSGVTLSYRIDVQGLLDPISRERPAGESLRYEGTYDRIQEARREDDHTLSQGIYKSRLKRADWEAAEAICVEALEQRSKDLQIAGWLLEAWLHLHGFRGVEAGLRLLAGLCENFWNDLYPNLDGKDFEDRIAPIEWINQKLSLRLKQIPLTLPQERDDRSYSYVDWESACHFENLARKDPSALQEALANIDPTVGTFQNALTLTDESFHLDLVEALAGAVDACRLLQQLLDEKCEKQSPSLYQFSEGLGAVQQLMSQSLQAREGGPAVVKEEPELSAGAEPSQADIEVWTSGPIRNRADAYRRLSEAADYLLRTEPHSPTPYLVKRAVEWGHMSLFEVFQQIVRNEGEMEELDRLLRLTGKKVADMN
jgi:type VI secretion system ImpA family protein